MKKATAAMMIVILLLSAFLKLTFNTRAQQSTMDWWTMFRHDQTHRGYSNSTAPNLNQALWSFTTAGNIYSSPAVVDGKVYVGSLDRRVYALNASNGELYWSFTTSNTVYSSPR